MIGEPNEPGNPAYRIVTERLVLRCYEPRDAAPLKAAVDRSLAHLVPWLAWARAEPQSLDAKVELLRQFRGQFDLGQDFVYGIFDEHEEEVLGGCGLHMRGGEWREIGYWIAHGRTGLGYATEAAAALVRAAFEIERLERVEIHCDPENVKSSAVAKKLGFRHDATLRERMPRADGTLGDCMLWSLFVGEYLESQAARVSIDAFDAIGRPLATAKPARSTARRSAFL